VGAGSGIHKVSTGYTWPIQAQVQRKQWGMVPSTGHLTKPKLLQRLHISSFKPEVTTTINNKHIKVRN